MSDTAIPELIDALYTTARGGLEHVHVYDGYGVSDEPGDFLMVGVDDPDNTDAASAAEAQQSWAGTGRAGGRTPRNEEGDVVCVAVAWIGDSGDGSAKVARDRAFAVVSGLYALIAAEHTLGVGSLLWAVPGFSHQLWQDQNDSGAVAMVTFRIHFRAYHPS